MGQSVNGLAFRLGYSLSWVFMGASSAFLYYFDFSFYVLRIFLYVRALCFLRYHSVFAHFGFVVSNIGLDLYSLRSKLCVTIFVYDCEFDFYFDMLGFVFENLRSKNLSKRQRRLFYRVLDLPELKK